MRRSAESLEFVGERLREIRRTRGLSQQEVAERVGIPQSNLSRIENGKQRLNLSVLVNILGLYRMTLDDFFSGAEARQPVNDREERLLRTFRGLDETGRREVEDYMQFKAARKDGEEPGKEDAFLK